MELFPYALLRIGGGTFSHLNHLRLSKSHEMAKVLHKRIEEKEKAKLKLCDNLLEHIKTLDDNRHQNLLQNLRRDIFNDRKVRTRVLKKAEDTLGNTPLNAELKRYGEMLSELNAFTEKGKHYYEKDLAEVRNVLKPLIKSDTLQKGLILSSMTLLDRIPSYISRSPAQLRKKEVKVEQSLLKYLSRIYAKTSPFSTFTNLATAGYKETGEVIKTRSVTADKPAIISHIRLNNHLYRYIVNLLMNYRQAYILLPLRVNPTILREKDQYLFLTNSNNIESFQRIPFNPVIDHIYQLVIKSDTGIIFEDLIRQVSEKVDADLAELERFIKELVDVGFFEYNLGVSGIDPDWDLHLNKALEPLICRGVSGIEALKQSLVQVRKMAEKYAMSSVDQRKKILKEVFDDLKEVFHSIHEAAGLPEHERMSRQERLKWIQSRKESKNSDKEKDSKASDAKKEFKHLVLTKFDFRPEQIFYEDTTREVNVALDAKAMKQITAKLNDLMEETSVFIPQEEERIKRKTYFLRKYGSKGKVSVLKFYEDYFRDFKQPEKELQESLKEKEQPTPEEVDSSNTFLYTPDVKKRSSLLSQWNGMLSELLSEDILSGTAVNLRLDDLKKVNKELNIQRKHSEKGFHGAFQQLYLDQSMGNQPPQLKAVLNSTFMGYGKMMSRFFHILDQQVFEISKKTNKSLMAPDVLFLEATDASYFNANLHPPLMPYEIRMPGGHNSVSEENQLPITDFSIQYQKDKKELELIHDPTGRQAFAFNLGFQGFKGRSELFQLLELFVPEATGYPQFLNKAINSVVDRNSSAESPFKVYPRVIFEDQIILQRKRWYMAKTIIPIKESNEDDWTYLTRVVTWREQYGIPSEVFVTINPMRDTSQLSKEQAKKLTRDDYKPQYIDFQNPLLLQLFSKLIDKAPAGIKIEEMLPGSEQLLKINDKPYVSEFVVQWMS